MHRRCVRGGSMILYHEASLVRSLEIMLRGFHDRRDAGTHPFGRGITFQVDPDAAARPAGIVLNVEDATVLRRFAVSLWPQRRSGLRRNFFYLLPADVANCYVPAMIGEVSEITRAID